MQKNEKVKWRSTLASPRALKIGYSRSNTKKNFLDAGIQDVSTSITIRVRICIEESQWFDRKVGWWWKWQTFRITRSYILVLKIIFKGPLVWIIFELTNRVTYYISLQQQYCHVQSRIPIFILNGIWKDCPCFVFLQSTRNIKVLSFLVFTYKVFHSQLLDLSQFHHISTMKTIISWLTWLIIEFRAFVSEILDDLIWVSLPQNIFIKNTFTMWIKRGLFLVRM